MNAIYGHHRFSEKFSNKFDEVRGECFKTNIEFQRL